jgi:hypothetical protein
MGDLSQHGPQALSIVRHGSRLLSRFANGDSFFSRATFPTAFRHGTATATSRPRHSSAMGWLSICTNAPLVLFGPGFRTPSEYLAPTSSRRGSPNRVPVRRLTARRSRHAHGGENGRETPDRGRVGMWRGGARLTMSVAAPFVWRCLSRSAITPFPHPAHRTQQADFPHCALGQDLTPSPTTGRGRAGSDVRARSTRRGARVDSSRACVACPCA